MALRKAGISLTIEGQAAYKAGLTEINREQRLLAEQAKLAVAQLGTQASRQQTYSTNMDHYAKRIQVAADNTDVLRTRQKELPGVQDQISKSIKNTTQAYQDSAKETERLKNNYEQMKTALGSNHEMTKKAKEEYQASKVETKELADELKKLEKTYNSNEKELSNLPFALNKAELATQQLRNEAQKLHEEYRNAGGRYADLSKSFGDMGDKLTHAGGIMQNTGRNMSTWITLPLMGVASIASKLGIEFEDTMATVQATSGATGEELALLEAKAREMGATTRYSASESAEALYYMSLAGWDSTQMLGALEGVMNLAAASGEDLALVSDIVTDAMTAFGLEAEQAAYFADVLAKSASSSNTTVAGLGGAFQYVAPVAGALGFTIEDTAIALGLLANQGIKGQKAGTALRRVFTNLVKPTKSSMEAMKDLNIEVANSDGSMKSLEEIMLILRDRFKGLTEEQMANYAGLLAGQEGMSGLLSIVNTSESDFKDLTSAIRDNSGAAKDMSDIMEDTFGGKLRTLRSGVEEVALSFFDSMYPALDGLVDKAKSGADFLNSLSVETRENIVQWGMFALAAGPVISTLGKVTTGVGTLSGGMSDLIKWYGKVTTPKLVGDMTTSFATIGGGATTTAAEIGGLSATIGGLPVVIGVAGAALLGFTAWKLWGEDAWNSARRTREWGTDVGETVGNTLSEIKGFSDRATGQFSLMSQGLSKNTGEMSANFASMGEVIENSLKDRISKLDELIAGLPETVKASLTKILEEDKKQAENSLKIVEENNSRIAEIRKKAAEEDGQLSIFQAKMIQDLNKQSAKAYIDTLKISQQEKKSILDAMNGDVETATQEEARIWAKNLAKQRQEQKLHYNEQKQDYLAALKELGYSEDAIREHEKIWEAANKATTDGIDQQLAIIAEKYPEIMEEISFANGQTVESMGLTSEEIKKANQDIIDSAISMSATVAATAERNAEKLRWMGDETTHAGQIWNGVILDPKTGEIKTNVRETVIEAAKDKATWDSMRFQLHDADLDSNAKKIIGEAAIENGRWDNMSWDEKEVILEDEFSITMHQALVETGKWNELSVKEKTALLYSNTPEIMAQTMFDLGLWNDYHPQIKDLNATNHSVLNAISQSETAMKQYNAAPVELKTLLAKDPSTLTFNESRKALEAYNNLPEDLKKLLAYNTDAMKKINAAKEAIKTYNENFKPGPKHLHATTNASEVADSARRAFASVNSKTVVLTARYQTVGSAPKDIGPYATRNEKGTNYHPGGPMIVNDQKGPLYKELVTFPDGKAFIPEGRDVFIPNAPRGTKVLKASSTRNLIPKYEKGIGFDRETINSLASNNVSTIESKGDSYQITVNAYGELSYGTIRKMAQTIQKEIKNENDRKRRSRGEAAFF